MDVITIFDDSFGLFRQVNGTELICNAGNTCNQRKRFYRHSGYGHDKNVENYSIECRTESHEINRTRLFKVLRLKRKKNHLKLRNAINFDFNPTTTRGQMRSRLQVLHY